MRTRRPFVLAAVGSALTVALVAHAEPVQSFGKKAQQKVAGVSQAEAAQQQAAGPSSAEQAKPAVAKPGEMKPAPLKPGQVSAPAAGGAPLVPGEAPVSGDSSMLAAPAQPSPGAAMRVDRVKQAALKRASASAAETRVSSVRSAAALKIAAPKLDSGKAVKVGEGSADVVAPGMQQRKAPVPSQPVTSKPGAQPAKPVAKPSPVSAKQVSRQ